MDTYQPLAAGQRGLRRFGDLRKTRPWICGACILWILVMEQREISCSITRQCWNSGKSPVPSPDSDGTSGNQVFHHQTVKEQGDMSCSIKSQ